MPPYCLGLDRSSKRRGLTAGGGNVLKPEYDTQFNGEEEQETSFDELLDQLKGNS